MKHLCYQTLYIDNHFGLAGFAGIRHRAGYLTKARLKGTISSIGRHCPEQPGFQQSGSISPGPMREKERGTALREGPAASEE